MQKLTTIRVMISSRSNQVFPYKGKPKGLLSHIRKDLAERLDKEPLLGSELFETWINERAPAEDPTENIWERCLDEVRRADIVIALYNGDAGWGKAPGEIGICHAEIKEAMDTARAKLRILQLDPPAPIRGGDDQFRDAMFRDYLKLHYPFTGTPCRSGEEIIEQCCLTVRDVVGQLTKLGVREARRGKFTSGDALVWSRLDFRSRQHAMQQVLEDALEERHARVVDAARGAVALSLHGTEVLLVCSAIPASLSIPEAREGVNQMFLRDYQYAAQVGGGVVGPVHFIACHRSVTETQAIRQLGFPDAVVVSPSFGVYVADEIQKVQLVFLSNCRDRTSTYQQVQRAFDWLEEVGESSLLIQRAASRSRIVQAVAAERELKKVAGR